MTGRSVATPIELVDAVGCTAGRPDRPAANGTGLGTAGGAHDGIPG